jgi:hypothetical protein
MMRITSADSRNIREDLNGLDSNKLEETVGLENVFAPNSSLGEKIKGAYMPSWVLLSMTAVEERVRKRTTKL